MILHQSKGVKVEGIFGFVFSEVREIGPKIPVIKKNPLLLISPGNYVVQGTEGNKPSVSELWAFYSTVSKIDNTLL
jgi:hypothetical protein